MVERTRDRCGRYTGEGLTPEEKRARTSAYNRQHHAANRERRREYGRLYREANRAHVNAQSLAYNAGHREELCIYARARYHAVRRPQAAANPLPKMLYDAQRRAAARGGACSITLEDLAAVNGTHCPVFGTQYVFGNGADSRSLDRIRPHLGYVPGNVAIISHRANRIKQDATSAELQRVASLLADLETGIFPALQPSHLNELIVSNGRGTMRYKTRLLIGARHRAVRDGVAFTITADDFVIPDRCPYFGIELRKGNGRLERYSPSLDRIDSTKGYVPGNVIVISRRVNVIKNDATAAEIMKVVQWLEAEER